MDDGQQKTPLAEIKSFFDSAPPLKDGEGITRKLKGFIERNSASSGKFNFFSAMWLVSVFLVDEINFWRAFFFRERERCQSGLRDLRWHYCSIGAAMCSLHRQL